MALTKLFMQPKHPILIFPWFNNSDSSQSRPRISKGAYSLMLLILSWRSVADSLKCSDHRRLIGWMKIIAFRHWRKATHFPHQISVLRKPTLKTNILWKPTLKSHPISCVCFPNFTPFRSKIPNPDLQRFQLKPFGGWGHGAGTVKAANGASGLYYCYEKRYRVFVLISGWDTLW